MYVDYDVCRLFTNCNIELNQGNKILIRHNIDYPDSMVDFVILNNDKEEYVLTLIFDEAKLIMKGLDSMLKEGYYS